MKTVTLRVSDQARNYFFTVAASRSTESRLLSLAEAVDLVAAEHRELVKELGECRRALAALTEQRTKEVTQDGTRDQAGEVPTRRVRTRL